MAPREALGERDPLLLVQDRAGGVAHLDHGVAADAGGPGRSGQRRRENRGHGRIGAGVLVLVQADDAAGQSVRRAVPRLRLSCPQNGAGDDQRERLATRVEQTVAIAGAGPGTGSGAAGGRIAGGGALGVGGVFTRIQPAVAVGVLVGTGDHGQLPRVHQVRSADDADMPGAGHELVSVVRIELVDEGRQVDRLDVVVCIVRYPSRRVRHPSQRPLADAAGLAIDIVVAVVDHVVGVAVDVVRSGRLHLEIEVVHQLAAAVGQDRRDRTGRVGPAHGDAQLAVLDVARVGGLAWLPRERVRQGDWVHSVDHERLLDAPGTRGAVDRRRVVDRRLTRAQHVVDDQPGRRILDRVGSPDTPGRRVVRQGQDLVEDRPAVALRHVADDADREGIHKADVRAARPPEQLVGRRGLLGFAVLIEEVGARHQGRAHQAARELRHPVGLLSRRGRVEPLGKIIADQRPGGGRDGGGERRPVVLVVDFVVEHLAAVVGIVVVMAAVGRARLEQRRTEYGRSVRTRRHDDGGGAQRILRRRAMRRDVVVVLFLVEVGEDGPFVDDRGAHGHAVLGGRGRRNLRAVREVRIVIRRRAVEQIGPDDRRRRVGRVGPLASGRAEHHVVAVVHQERIDLLRVQRVDAVLRVVQQGIEVRGAERHDVQVDLVAPAGDALAGTRGRSHLRADGGVQAIQQDAGVDVAADLDQLGAHATRRKGRVLHDDARAARQGVQAETADRLAVGRIDRLGIGQTEITRRAGDETGHDVAVRVGAGQQRVARRPAVLDVLDRLHLAVTLADRMGEVDGLRQRLREVHRVDRDTVVRHRHDLRRHLRRAVVHPRPVVGDHPGGVQTAAVDPQLVKRPRQVEAFFRVADHHRGRELIVRQNVFGDLTDVTDRGVLGQLREVRPFRLDAKDLTVHAVVADVRVAHDLRQATLRRPRVLARPQGDLQVQHVAARAAPLDERHPTDLRVHLVRGVIRPDRLDVGQCRQAVHVRPVRDHQESALRNRPDHATDLADLIRDLVEPDIPQGVVAQLHDVHAVVGAAFDVGPEVRAGGAELGRHPAHEIVLLEVEEAEVRLDQSALVARRRRLEVLPERRQAVQARLRDQRRMIAGPPGVRDLIDEGSRILPWLRSRASVGPIDGSRRDQQQGEKHDRDESATDGVEVGTAAHQNLPKWEETPGR